MKTREHQETETFSRGRVTAGGALKAWDENNRALAQARAAGDEAWYERLLRERGAFRGG